MFSFQVDVVSLSIEDRRGSSASTLRWLTLFQFYARRLEED